MIRMDLARSGPCLPVGATCSQRFAYEWDEVGRLGRARRWDTAPGASIDDPLPGGTPAADLRYKYDAGDQRVIKHAVDTSGESFTLYLFESLELKRSQFGTAYSDGGSGPADYEVSVFTVVPYLLASGVRLARLAYEGMSEVPEVTPGTGAGQVNASVSQVHVFFELGDHLGSTSVVLDKATSELVERSTFQGYGATESDYRPGRWNAFREDYKFTGKEEDAEVGLTYFGKRYLNAYLGRWISADPLAIHAPGEADLNVYAYVSGSILRNVDPLGLEEEAAGGSGNAGDAGGGHDSQGNTPTQEQEDSDAGYLAGVKTYAVNNEAKSLIYDVAKRYQTDMGAADRIEKSGHPEFAKDQRAAAEARFVASLKEIAAWRDQSLAQIAANAPNTDAGKRGFAEGNTRAAFIQDKIVGGIVEASLSAVLGAVGARIASAGALAARKALQGTLATGHGEAVFWSGLGKRGDQLAADWARKHGGSTLEMTLDRKGIKLPAFDPDNPKVVGAWRRASAEFARGAKGDVRVLQGDFVGSSSTWAEVEFKALKGNPNVRSITAVDPASGNEVLLWSR